MSAKIRIDPGVTTWRALPMAAKFAQPEMEPCRIAHTDMQGNACRAERWKWTTIQPKYFAARNGSVIYEGDISYVEHMRMKEARRLERRTHGRYSWLKQAQQQSQSLRKP